MAFRFSPCDPCCSDQNHCPSGTTNLFVNVLSTCGVNIPISGAFVTVDLLEDNTFGFAGFTDGAGIVKMPVSQTGNYLVIATEDGFTTDSGVVPIIRSNCGLNFNITLHLTPLKYDGATFILTYGCQNGTAGSFGCVAIQGDVTVGGEVRVIDNTHIEWFFPGRNFVPGSPIDFRVTNHTGAIRSPIDTFITGDPFFQSPCGGIGGVYHLQDFPVCPGGDDGDFIPGYRCGLINCSPGTPWKFPTFLHVTSSIGPAVLEYNHCDGGPVWMGDSTFNFPACDDMCTAAPGGADCFNHLDSPGEVLINWIFATPRQRGIDITGPYALVPGIPVCLTTSGPVWNGNVAGFPWSQCIITVPGNIGQSVKGKICNGFGAQDNVNVGGFDTLSCELFFDVGVPLEMCPPALVWSVELTNSVPCGVFYPDGFMSLQI